jgi:hypothetical protein
VAVHLVARSLVPRIMTQTTITSMSQFSIPFLFYVAIFYLSFHCCTCEANIASFEIEMKINRKTNF